MVVQGRSVVGGGGGGERRGEADRVSLNLFTSRRSAICASFQPPQRVRGPSVREHKTSMYHHSVCPVVVPTESSRIKTLRHYTHQFFIKITASSPSLPLLPFPASEFYCRQEFLLFPNFELPSPFTFISPLPLQILSTF